MNQVEYIPSGMEKVRLNKGYIEHDIVRSYEKSYGWRDEHLSGAAITKLPEPLDDFKSLPNNCNYVRYQYKEILAQVAESNLLDDLLSQLYGTKGTFTKLSNNLGDLIRKSNYGLS